MTDDAHPSGASRRRAERPAAVGADVVQTAAEEREARENEIDAAFAAVFKPNPAHPADPVGIVLKALRQEGFAERSTFSQGQPDLTLFREGRRAMLVYIEQRVRRGNELVKGSST